MREMHGLSQTPEHVIWCHVMERCTNPKSADWANYGGRGITICDRWRSSFTAFLADMGQRPSPTHSIDRKNNDGNYEPGNCRWATLSEQHRNRRVQNKFGWRWISQYPNGDFSAVVKPDKRAPLRKAPFRSAKMAALAANELARAAYGDDCIFNRVFAP